MATPRPVPQIRSARSASPSATLRAAATARWGYAVESSAATPISTTEATRLSASSSAFSASLYSTPASSLPMTMRQPSVLVILYSSSGRCGHVGHGQVTYGQFRFDVCGDPFGDQSKGDGTGIGVAEALFSQRAGAALERAEVRRLPRGVGGCGCGGGEGAAHGGVAVGR